jgi:hypothetical protein
MRRPRTKSNVDPRAAAVIIIAVLVAVQYAWWRGLVHHRAPSAGGGPQAGGGAQTVATATGWEDAKVETLAGSPEPGFSDGPGRNARFDSPTGITVDQSGALVVADTLNHRIRLVNPDGAVSTLAGGAAGDADGPAADARFSAPCGVAAGRDGTVYVADTGNHRIRAIKGGQVTTVAGGAAGKADGPARAARFDGPSGIALTADGAALLITDTRNKAVRRLDLTTGIVSTARALPSSPAYLAASAGGMDVALPAANTLLAGATTLKATGIAQSEGGPAVAEQKLALRQPMAVCAAPLGRLFTDAGHGAVFLLRGPFPEVVAGSAMEGRPTFGHRDGNGQNASFGQLSGVAVDAKGRIYVADTSNNCIRRITLP